MLEPFARRGRPSVRVPVLSKTTVSTPESFSSAAPSLIITPLRKSTPLATACTAGTARPNAQGQVMIRTAMAVISETCQSPPVQRSQPASVVAASMWTAGE